MLWFSDKLYAPWKYLAKNLKLALGCSNASTLQKYNKHFSNEKKVAKSKNNNFLIPAVRTKLSQQNLNSWFPKQLNSYKRQTKWP